MSVSAGRLPAIRFIVVCLITAKVTPYLKVEAPAGKVIHIRTDNYEGGSQYTSALNMSRATACRNMRV